ncbi:UrcA family protein [Phenylobacterium sp. LjRoot219]|uniref:UrcA family protein n=1 Tax=Phenylobacterium sp. LjRoot219 TaxID=3342283 RepID=UPI003ED09AA8
MRQLAPFVLALSLLAPVVAHAAPAAAMSEEPVVIQLNHWDLDLRQPQGAATMLARLERASLSACGASPFSYRLVQDEVRASACYRESLDRTVAALGAPAVTDLHRARAN